MFKAIKKIIIEREQKKLEKQLKILHSFYKRNKFFTTHEKVKWYLDLIQDLQSLGVILREDELADWKRIVDVFNEDRKKSIERDRYRINVS
jgi:hypothetical protein